MMDRSRLIRYIAYTLEILILFILQQTPGLFPEIFGVRPLLVIPAVITIAMFEPELAAMGFGIFGGLFMDYGGGGSLGFYALVLALLCFVISIIFNTVLQVNIGTAIITALWTVAIIVSLSWLFQFFLKGYSMPGYAFLHHYVPKYCYTLILFPLIFLINRGLAKHVRQQE